MCKNVDDGGSKDHSGSKKEEESNHQNSKTDKLNLGRKTSKHKEIINLMEYG